MLRAQVDKLREAIMLQPQDLEREARRFTQRLALTVQATLMLQHAGSDSASAFIGSRFDPGLGPCGRCCLRQQRPGRPAAQYLDWLRRTPAMMNFISLLDQQARTRPEKTGAARRRPGLELCRAGAGRPPSRTVLYEQGVRQGDKVGLLCFNTPGFVFALLGAWRLGAVVVPINHKLQAPEVSYILRHSGARLCLVDGARASLITAIQAEPQPLADMQWLSTASAAEGLDCFDELLAQAAPCGDEHGRPAPHALAEILYTSGTTGQPKGCLHSHANVFHAALCAAAATSLAPTERTLIAMPIWHSSPLNNWFWAPCSWAAPPC